MKNPKQHLILSTISPHVLAALTLMSGGGVVKMLKPQVGVNNVFNQQDATSISASGKGAAFDQCTFVPERSWTVSLNADF
ncbi:hypothetical protein GTP91_24255 [Rugamonas sp. FT82W]|uniref:TonB-dependent receptor n=1 Tax=Duganella vulcania TaxID=2692166 RepID=A0A845G6G0_9BURK|nr:hypothetical protein [Duganella vulcania]MYM90273.1 hypothetical protein [Duganella vulcania]